MEQTDSHRTVNLRCEHEAKIQLRLETLGGRAIVYWSGVEGFRVAGFRA